MDFEVRFCKHVISVSRAALLPSAIHRSKKLNSPGCVLATREHLLLKLFDDDQGNRHGIGEVLRAPQSFGMNVPTELIGERPDWIPSPTTRRPNVTPKGDPVGGGVTVLSVNAAQLPQTPSRLMTDGLRWPPDTKPRGTAFTVEAWRPVVVVEAHQRPLYILPRPPTDWRPYRGLIGTFSSRPSFDDWDLARRRFALYSNLLRARAIVSFLGEKGKEGNDLLDTIYRLYNNNEEDSGDMKSLESKRQGGDEAVQLLMYRSSGGFGPGRGWYPSLETHLSYSRAVGGEAQDGFPLALTALSNGGTFLYLRATVTPSRFPGWKSDGNGRGELDFLHDGEGPIVDAVVAIDLVDLFVQFVVEGSAWLYKGLRTGPVQVQEIVATERKMSAVAFMSGGASGLDLVVTTSADDPNVPKWRYLPPETKYEATFHVPDALGGVETFSWSDGGQQRCCAIIREFGELSFGKPELKFTRAENGDDSVICGVYKRMVVVWILSTSKVDSTWSLDCAAVIAAPRGRMFIDAIITNALDVVLLCDSSQFISMKLERTNDLDSVINTNTQEEVAVKMVMNVACKVSGVEFFREATKFRIRNLRCLVLDADCRNEISHMPCCVSSVVVQGFYVVSIGAQSGFNFLWGRSGDPLNYAEGTMKPLQNDEWMPTSACFCDLVEGEDGVDDRIHFLHAASTRAGNMILQFLWFSASKGLELGGIYVIPSDKLPFTTHRHSSDDEEEDMTKNVGRRPTSGLPTLHLHVSGHGSMSLAELRWNRRDKELSAWCASTVRREGSVSPVTAFHYIRIAVPTTEKALQRLVN